MVWLDTASLTPLDSQERFAGDKGKNQSSSQQHSSLDPLYKPLSASREAKDSGTASLSSASSDRGPLVGENTSLEKPYLRLTTHPRKEDVRPLRVLIKSLAHIKSRYVQDEDFAWANEQLKSVRQDLTVQQIRNRFVLDVYETHGRILLEHGDLDEFNQCQTMIRSLTEGKRGVDLEDSFDECDFDPSDATGGSDGNKPLQQSPECADEFRGYSILYAYVRSSWLDVKTELARCRLSMAKTAAAVAHDSPQSHHSSCALHAVSVVRAMDDHDYRTFFRLYRSAPHMSAYLMDFLVKRTCRIAWHSVRACVPPGLPVRLDTV
jgi:SAC3 family protein LENG8/THP3